MEGFVGEERVGENRLYLPLLPAVEKKAKKDISSALISIMEKGWDFPPDNTIVITIKGTPKRHHFQYFPGLLVKEKPLLEEEWRLFVHANRVEVRDYSRWQVPPYLQGRKFLMGCLDQMKHQQRLLAAEREALKFAEEHRQRKAASRSALIKQCKWKKELDRKWKVYGSRIEHLHDALDRATGKVGSSAFVCSLENQLHKLLEESGI